MSIKEAAEKYAGKEPSIGTTRSLELSMREIWEGDREAFLAGAKAGMEEAAKGCVSCNGTGKDTRFLASTNGDRWHHPACPYCLHIRKLLKDLEG